MARSHARKMGSSNPLVLCFGALLAVFAAASESEPGGDRIPASLPAARDRVGKRLPPVESSAWLNTPNGGPPQIKGKVVLLRFWTDGCPFCERSAPALNEFHKEFADRGLVVIGMYHPKPPGLEAGLEEIRAAAKRLGFDFPIGVDEDWDYLKKTWLETGRERPATSCSFLVDREDAIRYAHPGPEFFASDDPEESESSREYENIKRAIEILIAQPSADD